MENQNTTMSLRQKSGSNSTNSSTIDGSEPHKYDNRAAEAGFQAPPPLLPEEGGDASLRRPISPHQDHAVSQPPRQDIDAQKNVIVTGNDQKVQEAPKTTQDDENAHKIPRLNSKQAPATTKNAEAAKELEGLSARVFLLQPEPSASSVVPSRSQLHARRAVKIHKSHSIASKSTLTRSIEDDADGEDAAALLEKYLAASGQDPLAAKAIAKAFAAQAQEEDSSKSAPNSSMDRDGSWPNLYPTVSTQRAPVPASALPPLKHSNTKTKPHTSCRKPENVPFLILAPSTRQEATIAQFLRQDNDIGNAQKSASVQVQGTSTAEVVQSQNEIAHTKPNFDSKKSGARLRDVDAANELESLSTRLFLSQPEPTTSLAPSRPQLQARKTGTCTKIENLKEEKIHKSHSIASKSTLTRSIEDDADEEDAATLFLLEKYLAASGQDPL
eukprot:CAMPEP_0198303304 /NCGR_PEP_ID=MMETSP1449-20131203/56818_1 /TAXON_ID=420275 /ORGANISM="Attheya septentrionalis, Strain CCMP2084" /LENGTH=441 /DNA_ID=CAMNT_0044005791 /DNA_START=64 /DNA_END=1387 /DNA_ORIENTATION=-